MSQPDIALLRITPPSGITPVKIGSSAGLVQGQPLVVVGNPGGMGNWVATLGSYVQLRDAFDLDGNPVREFKATTPSMGGNSGSPVFDLEGNVVGVLWGGEAVDVVRRVGDPIPPPPASSSRRPDCCLRSPSKRPWPSSSPGVDGRSARLFEG